MDRADDEAAPAAVVHHLLELREHPRAPRDDARDLDQAVQVRLADVADLVQDGELGDADVDVARDALVRGVELERLLLGDVVEDAEHVRGRVRDPDREHGLALGEVEVGHLDALAVADAHLADALAVDELVGTLRGELAEETTELFANLRLGALARDPLAKRAVVVLDVHLELLLLRSEVFKRGRGRVRNAGVFMGERWASVIDEEESGSARKRGKEGAKVRVPSFRAGAKFEGTWGKKTPASDRSPTRARTSSSSSASSSLSAARRRRCWRLHWSSSSSASSALGRTRPPTPGTRPSAASRSSSAASARSLASSSASGS